MGHPASAAVPTAKPVCHRITPSTTMMPHVKTAQPTPSTRRLFHISMIVLPVAYQPVSAYPFLWAIILLIMLGNLLAEGYRLQQGITWIGQRYYEKTTPSAFFWTITALCLLFVYLPQTALHTPIILSAALADPLLGICREKKIKPLISCTLTLSILYIIWCATYVIGSIPLVYACIMPPLILWAEHYDIPYIDDNARMILWPMLFVWLVQFSQTL